MLNQSFRQVFVLPNGTPIGPGRFSTDLVPGQLGVFDIATSKSLSMPTLFENPIIRFGQGNPDSDLPRVFSWFSGTEFSKDIVGMRIKGWRGKKASRTVKNMVVAVDVPSLPCDTRKTLYIKLTGGPVDKIMTTQGLNLEYYVETGCCNDCDADCNEVDCSTYIDALVKQINDDTLNHRGLLRAWKQVTCTPAVVPVTTVTCKVYEVSICDCGDAGALAYAQSQYPDARVVFDRREGSNSVYQLTQAATLPPPVPFTNQGIVVIPECDVCPAGYTFADGGFVYSIRYEDECIDESAAVLALVPGGVTVTKAGVTVDNPNGTCLYGSGVYTVTTAVALTEAELIAIRATAPVEGIVYVGISADTCVLTTPTTFPWIFVKDLISITKDYQLIIKNDDCNISYLAELQALYPMGIVSEISNINCVSTFKLTITSDCTEAECVDPNFEFLTPQAFKGIDWEEIKPSVTSTVCACKLILETAYQNKITNECTYHAFDWDFDTVHMQVSQCSFDYYESPCDETWKIRVLQNVQYSQGTGQWVYKQELKSKGYLHQRRSNDAVQREIYGPELYTELDEFYDEYTLEYQFEYNVLGWAQHYSDSYHQVFYVKEGTGKPLENLINGYIASIGLPFRPVVL